MFYEDASTEVSSETLREEIERIVISGLDSWNQKINKISHSPQEVIAEANSLLLPLIGTFGPVSLDLVAEWIVYDRLITSFRSIFGTITEKIMVAAAKRNPLGSRFKVVDVNGTPGVDLKVQGPNGQEFSQIKSGPRWGNSSSRLKSKEQLKAACGPHDRATYLISRGKEVRVEENIWTLSGDAAFYYLTRDANFPLELITLIKEIVRKRSEIPGNCSRKNIKELKESIKGELLAQGLMESDEVDFQSHFNKNSGVLSGDAKSENPMGVLGPEGTELFEVGDEVELLAELAKEFPVFNKLGVLFCHRRAGSIDIFTGYKVMGYVRDGDKDDHLEGHRGWVKLTHEADGHIEVTAIVPEYVCKHKDSPDIFQRHENP